MEPQRPNSPKVIGLLSIIFGAIVAVFSLLGLGSSSMSMSSIRDLGSELVGPFESYLAALQPWATVITVVMIAMSAGLVFIGIGQRGYRRWARTAAIAWSIAALVVLVGQLAFYYGVTGPALERLVKSISGSPIADMMSGMSSSMGLIALVLYTPYPVIQLVLMRKPHVVAAMTA